MNEDLHVPCPACPRRFRAAGDLLAHCRGCHPKYKFTEDQQRAYSCYHCEACKLPFSRYNVPEGHRHAANCRGVPADSHAPTPARTRYNGRTCTPTNTGRGRSRSRQRTPPHMRAPLTRAQPSHVNDDLAGRHTA
eukprot:jgi/Ulvmu1/8551/UM044_0085.1